MKTLIIIALTLAGMVPASTFVQTLTPSRLSSEGIVGRASSLDFGLPSIPKSRARTLDLRAQISARWPAFPFNSNNKLANAPNPNPPDCNDIPPAPITKKESQSQSSISSDSCQELLAQTNSWIYEQEYDVAFDSLHFFLTTCYNSPYAVKGLINLGDCENQTSETKTDSGREALRHWLLTILPLNKQPDWFCNCVVDIMGSYDDGSYNALASDLAILNYLINNPLCENQRLNYSQEYDDDRHLQRSLWASNNPGVPFDSTLPSLHDLGLDSVLKYAALLGVHDPNMPSIISNASASPNPVGEGTEIYFSTNREAYVMVRLYNLLGQDAGSLKFEGVVEPGNHEVPLSLAGLPSGTYYARIQTTYGEVQTVKLVKE